MLRDVTSTLILEVAKKQQGIIQIWSTTPDPGEPRSVFSPA